jgi:hypothetical protein
VAHTWESLNALTVARQFPDGDLPPVDLAARIGPMQTQTARSAFIGLGARSALATHATVTDAYESTDLVRGTTLRGTVHTATRETHRFLDATARLTAGHHWRTVLGLDDPEVHHSMWAGLEEFAAEQWRTPAELRDHLLTMLSEAGQHDAVERLESEPTGRYFGFIHGGMVRRPLTGPWSGQGAPGYRAAYAVTGLPLPPTETALPELVRRSLAAHGPASRHDLAWWSGLRVGRIAEVLGQVDDLICETGPDGREYVDLPDRPPGRELDDVRLLPEFDAVLCAYEPSARGRFVAPEHHRALWRSPNGLVLPPLLVDGRVGGHWRSTGSAKRRPLEVTWFAGTRKPRKSELADAVRRLEASLDITVTALDVRRGP